MRTIKFRGKAKSDIWYEGDLMHYDNGDMAIKPNESVCVPVIPETVGQFTGLYDKNGKEIYEGDILKSEEDENRQESIYAVVYSKPFAAFILQTSTDFDWFDFSEVETKYEVIGNIYDNPNC